MTIRRCGICFEVFDVDTEPEHAHFDYYETAGHEEAYPDELSFCQECCAAVEEVTDHWTSPYAVEFDCAFCGDEGHEGTRLSVRFTAQNDRVIDTSLPMYDLCSECDDIFSNFLASERADALDVPDGWSVFGPTARHVFGIGTDHNQIYIEPAIKQTASGVESMSSGVPEGDANCYAVMLVKNVGTVSEGHSEIAAFDEATDAIEFTELVAHYAVTAPTPTEFVGQDFEPDPMEEDPWRLDPIISDEDPYEVAEKLLGYQSYHLDDALEEHTG